MKNTCYIKIQEKYTLYQKDCKREYILRIVSLLTKGRCRYEILQSPTLSVQLVQPAANTLFTCINVALSIYFTLY